LRAVIGCLLCLWPLLAPAQDADKQRFTFDGWAGPPIEVYIGRPEALAEDAPVVFVMHGVRRNADEYRDQWYALALEHSFLLVVPEFTREAFQGADGYNLGNTLDSDGEPKPVDTWSFSVLEPLFETVRKRYGLVTGRYALYGHSAGGQFVHRFAMHVPDARVSAIVPANAGWYTLPEFDLDWPYGLRGSAIDEESLAAALQLPITLLLGDRDTDPSHPSLRHTPEADAQGMHRFARGFTFYESGRQAALSLGVPFNWHLATVRGVDHDNARMAPAAVPLLLQR
jgi:pimeloyl-ACP methyl ester carboxylesterase